MKNSSTLSPEEAALELLKRRRARRSYIEYAKAVTIPGVPVEEDDYWLINPIETSVAKHHLLIVDAADKLIHGELVHEGREADGVITMAPPGSAKSTYLDVVVPTAAMGEIPGYQVILTGYGSNILKKHGKRARQICASPEYRSIYNTSLRGDTKAADQWALDNGSEYMSGGLLAGLTGNRGDLLIVDDPVKGRQEAESEVTRESIWNAYIDDAVSRLKPSGKQFIIQTRWHEDDLAGRILPEDWAGDSGFIEGRDGRLWYVICLQAECERDDDPLGREIGEIIWPEWFTPQHLAPFKASPRTWRSLFQQMPTADEGTFFRKEWFNSYSKRPEHLNIYISGDFAVTEDGGDYTEIGVWGVSTDKRVYLLDWWYGQTTADVWITEIVERIRYWKPMWFIGESGPIRRAIEPILRRRMKDENAMCALEWLSHSAHNKESAARPFQAIAAQGLVYLPKNDMAERVKDQLLRFPAGRYDDAVDACSLFGRFIDRTWAATEPRKPSPIPTIDTPSGHFDMPGLFETAKEKSW